MLETLLQTDRDLFLYLNNLGEPAWDGFWLFVTDKWSAIPFYLALLYLFYQKFGLRKTLLMLLAVTLLITVTDQLSNFFKYGMKRPRPCHEQEVLNAMRLVKAYCGGKYGFFSAHAGNSAALATFLLLLIRPHWLLTALIVVWATLVAYSRLYIGVHYPLDLLGGMATGLLMGWLFARLYILAVTRSGL